jgi:hypothetical protein
MAVSLQLAQLHESLKLVPAYFETTRPNRFLIEFFFLDRRQGNLGCRESRARTGLIATVTAP